VTREEAAAVGMVLAVHAAEAPERPAVTGPTGDRTFAELNGRANALVRALRRRGLKAGSAVAIVCANRPEFAEVYFATHRAGFRLTTVNWHLTAGEAALIVEDCEAEALVVDARFPELALSSVGVRLAVDGPLAGFEDYDEVVDAEDTSDIDDPVLGSTMLYTSGTTGRPKGVHRATPPPNAVATLRLYGYVPGEDRHLCTGPLYHAAPLAFSLNAPITAGVGVVLMDGWDA
jgi:long-chain acyl-CoA synthetase